MILLRYSHITIKIEGTFWCFEIGITLLLGRTFMYYESGWQDTCHIYIYIT